MYPLNRCRSEPQIAVELILTIASRELRIFGSGTFSTWTLFLLSQRFAFTATVLPPGRRIDTVERRYAWLRSGGWGGVLLDATATGHRLRKDDLTDLHHLLEGAQIVVDLAIGFSGKSFASLATTVPPGIE